MPRWVAWLPLLPLAFLASVVLALTTGIVALWGVALALWPVPLLSKRLAPLCVERSDGQLRLVSGILKETNGISMLNTIDPSGQLSSKANEVRAQLGDYYRAYPGQGDLNSVLE